MEIRNELRYLLSVGLWERMAADGLLTKEELARAKRLSVGAIPARNCLGIVLAIPAGCVVWFRCQKRWKETNEKWLKYK